MSSSWGKVLAPITVDATNDTFVGSDTGGAFTATITAGTYGTILELVDELATQMTAQGNGTYTGAVSSVGQVTISGDETWTWTEATTDNDLEAILGIINGDSVSSDILTPGNRHKYGWYPGVISYGTSSGTGVANDSRWTQDWSLAASVSGSGEPRIVVPSRPGYRRTLDFDLIKQTELQDVNRGIHALMVNGFGKVLRWYEDRDDGTVASPGTQADPHTAVWAATKYWEVMLAEPVKWQTAGSSADHYRTSLQLYGLPS